MCQGEKPSHSVLFSSSQPGWRTHSHVLPPATHWSCVFRSQHLHCTDLPGKTIITAHIIPSAIASCQDPAAQGEPAVQSHSCSAKPSHSHVCAKGYPPPGEGENSPKVTENHSRAERSTLERRSLPAGPGLGRLSWALPGTGPSLPLAHAYQIYI